MIDNDLKMKANLPLGRLVIILEENEIYSCHYDFMTSKNNVNGQWVRSC